MLKKIENSRKPIAIKYFFPHHLKFYQNDEIQMKHEEQIERTQDGLKEELERLRKENDGLKRELLTSNSLKIFSVLTENYKKIRDQNCDLTLELAGGKTLGVHKAILMGNL
jgi:hypothetical protein